MKKEHQWGLKDRGSEGERRAHTSATVTRRCRIVGEGRAREWWRERLLCFIWKPSPLPDKQSLDACVIRREQVRLLGPWSWLQLRKGPFVITLLELRTSASDHPTSSPRQGLCPALVQIGCLPHQVLPLNWCCWKWGGWMMLGLMIFRSSLNSYFPWKLSVILKWTEIRYKI